jgi:ABC-type bacteriocin/lantibiotic exporter with double-glycine peptidase domain
MAAKPRTTRSLLSRFPALSRLGFQSIRRIPYVQQTTAIDCGAACLAMVLGYYGKRVSLRECRETLGASRDGANAFGILKGGRHFGLRGRGVKIEVVESLKLIAPGAILHWRFNHFVVFDKMIRQGALIVDPAHGRRWVTLKELNRDFTGVALLFEPGEDFQRRESVQAKPAGVWRYIARIVRSGLISRILVTSILVQVLALAVPVLIALITNHVVPHSDWNLLTVLALGMGLIIVFHFLSSLIRAQLLLHLRTKLDAELTHDFVEHLLALPYVFFQQRPVGDLMMRLNSNQAIREILTSGTLSTLLDGTMILLYLALVFAFDVDMGLLVLALAVIRVGLFLITYKLNRRLMAESLQAQADAQAYAVQFLSGIEVLKASGVEARAIDRWSNLFVDSLNVSLRQGRLDAWVQSTLDALAVASPLMILVFGAWRVLAGDLSLGAMLALNALATGFLTPLSNLVSKTLDLQKVGSYLDRTEDVMETEKEQDAETPGQALRVRGGVALENVSFRYSDNTPFVVHDVSMHIKPGALIALVGASGSGKSTLARMLLGLYRPTQGKIFYDGLDLANLNLGSVRRQIGVVPQEPYLFSGSLRSNIALLDSTLPLHRIVEAARRAHIHQQIMAMPMGYETMLTEGGKSLSGGQRQRVALARALVHRPAILVLDEATSALDAVTESAILKELEVLRCTRIIVAHRLSTVKNADTIFVMRQGRIVEQGGYTELIARGGVFAELIAEQREQRAVAASH